MNERTMGGKTISIESVAKILRCSLEDLKPVAAHLGVPDGGWRAIDVYNAKVALNVSKADVTPDDYPLQFHQGRLTRLRGEALPDDATAAQQHGYNVTHTQLDFERRLRDYDQALVNLAATQDRCSELLEETRSQRAEISRLQVDLDEAVAMKDALGQKAMQLQEEVRDLRAAKGGILLSGWTCACGVFTGDVKGRDTCRACDTPRPA